MTEIIDIFTKERTVVPAQPSVSAAVEQKVVQDIMSFEGTVSSTQADVFTARRLARVMAAHRPDPDKAS